MPPWHDLSAIIKKSPTFRLLMRMRRQAMLSLALLATTLSLPVIAQVDSKIAEFCIKAQDFAGCVETMSRGLTPKQAQDVKEGLRTWTRDNGQIIRMRASTIVALRKDGQYGRYLEYRYGLEDKDGGVDWMVQADCLDYTANWDQDNKGWFQVRDPERYLRPGEAYQKYSSAKEAKAVLDEFCGRIETLPKANRDLSM